MNRCRRAALGLAAWLSPGLGLLACRAPAVPAEQPAPHVEHVEHVERVEPSAPDQAEPAEPARTSDPAPGPSWTAALTSSPCEHTCADVHACLRVEGRAPEAAAHLELGCLAACVHASTTMLACARPARADVDACRPFLACVDAAWSSRGSARPVVELPPDGCGLACAKVAGCRGAPVEAAQLCAEQCRAILDADQQRAAVRCAELDDCHAVERCVAALPGG